MLKKFIIGGVSFVFLISNPIMTVNAQGLNADKKATTYTDTTKYMNICEGINYTLNTSDGGHLSYGCNTYAIDEVYSTYRHSGSTEYRGRVETGNGNDDNGAWETGGINSEAQTRFHSGTQYFRHER